MEKKQITPTYLNGLLNTKNQYHKIMVVAILDLGTNTFHCLIVRIENNGSFKKIYKTKSPVKLGEGGINKNKIQNIPFERGIHALKEFNIKIRECKAEEVYAYGTAALRSADNSQEFIDRVYEETGIRIEIISGDLEAEYIYYGVRKALDLGTKNTLIMDIGGGSVEFIIANKEEIKWAHSFELGAARLLEIFKPNDPITGNQIAQAEKYLEENLEMLFSTCQDYKPQMLIGSSGSFDTFAEMIAHQFYSPQILENKTEYIFNLEEFNLIYLKLIASNRAERTQMRGMIPIRVDMIVIASIFVNLIINKLKIEKMVLSTHAMKEGILYSIIEKSKD